MKTVGFDYDEIHELVSIKKNWYWDGWRIVIVDYRRNGAMHPKGIYRKGRWGIQARIGPNSKGLWEVPIRNV